MVRLDNSKERFDMYRNGINAHVRVNGRSVREYSHEGLSFIESRHGTNYTIKIGNDNSYRVMVVVSVDGLDVITGKAAEKSNTGYLVDGYSSVEIKGYRISDSESAAFVFSSKGDSYVAQTTGDSRNAGVIGVRVFREKEVVKPVQLPKPISSPSPLWPSSPFTSSGPTIGDMACHHPQTYSKSLRSCRPGGCSAQSTFDSTQVSYSSFDTGTTWGNKQTDKVRSVEFERGDLLVEMALYYSSRKGLESMGIDLSDSPRIASTDTLPKPFGGPTYCQPPKGWNG